MRNYRYFNQFRHVNIKSNDFNNMLQVVISVRCSVFSYQLSAISYQLSAVSRQPSAVSRQLSAISGQPSAASFPQQL